MKYFNDLNSFLTSPVSAGLVERIGYPHVIEPQTLTYKIASQISKLVTLKFPRAVWTFSRRSVPSLSG